jgi:hypothetical protein
MKTMSDDLRDMEKRGDKWTRDSRRLFIESMRARQKPRYG